MSETWENGCGGNKLIETENYLQFGGAEWIKGKIQNLPPTSSIKQNKKP